MKFFLAIYFLVFFVSCGRLKLNYSRTTVIEKRCPCRLYVESFNGLYLSGDMSQYLTDSSNFRIYTGTFEQPDEFLGYECKEDSIYVSKHRKIKRTDSILIGGKAIWVRKPNFDDIKVERDSVVSITSYSIKNLRGN